MYACMYVCISGKHFSAACPLRASRATDKHSTVEDKYRSCHLPSKRLGPCVLNTYSRIPLTQPHEYE